jgi:lipoate-protein ligase A
MRMSVCFCLSGGNMQTQNSNAIGEVKYAKTIHIGSPRVKTLTECAIDVSHHCRRQFTAGQFIQYLIDNFAEAAKEKLKEQSKS